MRKTGSKKPHDLMTKNKSGFEDSGDLHIFRAKPIIETKRVSFGSVRDRKRRVAWRRALPGRAS